MNSSIYSLDRTTHLKIIAVAAMMAALVVVVGESAQVSQSGRSVSSEPQFFPIVRPNRPNPTGPVFSSPHGVRTEIALSID